MADTPASKPAVTPQASGSPVAKAPPVTNAAKAQPAKVGIPAPKTNPPGKPQGTYSHFSGSDVTADHLTALNASKDIPDDVKALVAGRIQKRAHKVTTTDLHIFDGPNDLTVTFHVKKIV